MNSFKEKWAEVIPQNGELQSLDQGGGYIMGRKEGVSFSTRTPEDRRQIRRICVFGWEREKTYKDETDSGS